MADPNDQSVEGTTASDQPGGNANAPDLDAVVQKAVAAALEQTDKRFQGFQSLIDRKLSDVTRQFKTAGLSPEEQEQLEADDNEALRRELEIYRMREQFPQGADVLLKIAKAETLDDQLSLIEQALSAGKLSQGEATQAAQAVVEQDAQTGGNEAPVPEVDRNNPQRELTPGLQSAMAGEMTEEKADAVLETFNQKGALRQR